MARARPAFAAKTALRGSERPKSHKETSVAYIHGPRSAIHLKHRWRNPGREGTSWNQSGPSLSERAGRRRSRLWWLNAECSEPSGGAGAVGCVAIPSSRERASERASQREERGGGMEWREGPSGEVGI